MDEDQALSALSALADATRLRILRYLVSQGPEGATAGAIGSAADAAPSRASFHLNAMTHAGLVHRKRVSRQMIYQVDFRALAALMAYLIEDCCAGHPLVRACCGPKETGE